MGFLGNKYLQSSLACWHQILRWRHGEGQGVNCLIAPWSCKVKQNVSFLVFLYLLYNSGGWDNAGGGGGGGIHTWNSRLPSRQCTGKVSQLLGKSPLSSLSNGLKNKLPRNLLFSVYIYRYIYTCPDT